MARSKNLHFVETNITVLQPTDPKLNWAEGTIQVDELLSKELGRTIRNGNSFRLVGYGANLKGYNTSTDQDTGFAGVAAAIYCPVTKNGCAAWKKMQNQWMRQKKLASTAGNLVRYDDFEVGWSPDARLNSVRNSTIRMSGLGDTSAEDVVLYGESVDGDVVSLEDFYDSLNPKAAVSRTPFGDIIKSSKFTNKFPDARQLLMPTSFSAQVESSWDPDAIVGGLATGDIQWLPSDNHLSHMTGTLFYYFKGVAQDTAGPNADELKLTITLVYEGWTPLNPSKKTYTPRKTYRRKSVSTSKPKRRYRRKS